MHNELLDDLLKRGLIANYNSPYALADKMNEGPILFYYGIDPTAKSY